MEKSPALVKTATYERELTNQHFTRIVIFSFHAVEGRLFPMMNNDRALPIFQIGISLLFTA
jgi:hypothetical protein